MDTAAPPLALRLVEDALARAAGRPLTRLVLTVGALADTPAAVLELHVESILRDRGVTGVQLETRIEPGRCRCTCGHEFDTDRVRRSCPACGELDTSRPVAGGECRIEAVEPT